MLFLPIPSNHGVWSRFNFQLRLAHILDAFQAELVSKRYSYARPGIEKTPFGTRDMSVNDPFGNRLTFTSAVST